MTVHYGVCGASGAHLLGYFWCQTAASDRASLTRELRLSVYFNGHTMAAFLFKNVLKNPPSVPHAPASIPSYLPYILDQ